MTSLLMSALLLAPRAHAQACEAAADVPDTVQVAWVSPMEKKARANTPLEVVRVKDLRAWARTHGADDARLLHGLGLVPRGGGGAADWEWKITIFDVRASWMCRPLEDAVGGEDQGGVVACEAPDAGRLRAHRHGYTGCGYTLDTAASTRGLDVFRISWESASS
ncbi:MAG: hypothetical protein VX265_04285, partial [Myxococcota bacterium]|nr:hypothetical protein [Myxococcota bacterium]